MCVSRYPDISPMQLNEHEAQPAITLAFKATSYWRCTTSAEQKARKMPRIFRVRLRSGVRRHEPAQAGVVPEEEVSRTFLNVDLNPHVFGITRITII